MDGPSVGVLGEFGDEKPWGKGFLLRGGSGEDIGLGFWWNHGPQVYRTKICAIHWTNAPSPDILWPRFGIQSFRFSETVTSPMVSNVLRHRTERRSFISNFFSKAALPSKMGQRP